jgi:ATP-dependent protease ClpP protease subunit
MAADEHAPLNGDDPIESPDQSPLYYALEQARYYRQDLIGRIEARTGRRLICYLGSTATSIGEQDIPPFVDLIDDLEPGADLDLMLHTPGGDVDRAEKIVVLCRNRVMDGKFRVVVPESAKSAGTLIAIAADEIVMGEPSELGPIDPQVTITTQRGEPMQRPAQSFLDGLDAIVEKAEEGLSAAYFPLLDKLDPALIDLCRNALLRSEKFAKEFLKAHMLKDDHEKADQIAEELNSVKKHLSHGAVIDAKKAVAMGLKVNLLKYDDDVWRAYWRLHTAQRAALTDVRERLFESRKVSLLFGPGR